MVAVGNSTAFALPTHNNDKGGSGGESDGGDGGATAEGQTRRPRPRSI